MEEKEPLHAGPRLPKEPEEDPKEQFKTTIEARFKKRKIRNLLLSTLYGAFMEGVSDNQPADYDLLLNIDLCFGVTVAALSFGLERVLISGAKDRHKEINIPIRYTAENSFYLGGGFILGRSIVRAAKNFYMF